MPVENEKHSPGVTILFVNGPNLSLLGLRRPEVYGTSSLADIEHNLRELFLTFPAAKLSLTPFQSDSEGALVTYFNEAYRNARGSPGTLAGIILNPGAYAHTSIALRDALELFQELKINIVEVHLSNVYSREYFRHHSWVSQVATAVICGMGPAGYLAAARFVLESMSK